MRAISSRSGFVLLDNVTHGVFQAIWLVNCAHIDLEPGAQPVGTSDVVAEVVGVDVFQAEHLAGANSYIVVDHQGREARPVDEDHTKCDPVKSGRKSQVLSPDSETENPA